MVLNWGAWYNGGREGSEDNMCQKKLPSLRHTGHCDELLRAKIMPAEAVMIFESHLRCMQVVQADSFGTYCPRCGFGVPPGGKTPVRKGSKKCLV